MTTVALIGLGGLGLFFGLLLGVASKLFHVEIDERVEMINEVLPQANCGACGYAGCMGLAEAIVKGEAEPSACTAGGIEVAKNISNIMGVSALSNAKKVAYLKCKGTSLVTKDKFVYNGAIDCKAASLIMGGSKSCAYGCLGLGTCVNICPFDAMKINKDTMLVEIDEEKCTGCGKCIKECPKNVLDLVPVNSKVRVACNSQDKGADVK
jgi:RnfABCDGE-type electron transport complex B subunit